MTSFPDPIGVTGAWHIRWTRSIEYEVLTVSPAATGAVDDDVAFIGIGCRQAPDLPAGSRDAHPIAFLE